MALIKVDFISKCLMRTVTVNAIIPFDKIYNDQQSKCKPPFKTLYLLHGIFGNYTDWVSGTRIQRWAEEKNLAVIMPSGENHFYLDSEKTGERFSEFIGQELPEKMEELFPLSSKREDRFIAGLSMGGFGAMINGLRFNETFSRIASLSGALITVDRWGVREKDLPKSIFGNYFYDVFFGDADKRVGSNCDIYHLAEKIKDCSDKPELYITCGLSDSLFEANQLFRDYCLNNGFNVTWYQEQGSHEWDFWDRNIKRVVDWLIPEVEDKSINSGNVQ